jgi:hypothetical protein
MAQNLNQFPQNPNLADVLNFFKKQIKLEMNCIHVGTIQSFDATNQTAEVTINYPKTFLSSLSVGDSNVSNVSYPVLSGCPVFILGGGSGCITMPISAGDECLILFNDRDISNWWGTGSSSTAPNTPRLHGFPDAMVLVGINSLPNVWVDYDDAAVTLRYGSSNTIKLNDSTAVVTIGSNTITLSDSDGNITVGANSIDLTDSAATVTVGSNTITLSGSDGNITVGANSIDLSETAATITVGSNTIVLNETEAQITAGTAMVDVGPALIKIANDVTDLNTLLQSFITDVNNIISALTTNAADFILVTGGPGGPSPINPAIPIALTAVSTALTTLSTEVSELLT